MALKLRAGKEGRCMKNFHPKMILIKEQIRPVYGKNILVRPANIEERYNGTR